MKLLASKLAGRGHEVLIEPHIPEGQTFKMPDSVVCGEDALTVVDVSVTGEELMDTVYAGKIRHYSTVEVEGNLRRILGKPADIPILHVPAIFSSRGSISPRSEARLRLLGLSTFDLSDLCLTVIRGSLKAYDVYKFTDEEEQRAWSKSEPAKAEVRRDLVKITSPLCFSEKPGSIIDRQCTVKRSKKRPLMVVWTNPDILGAHHHNKLQLLFKHSDDLRQDILTLQLLRNTQKPSNDSWLQWRKTFEDYIELLPILSPTIVLDVPFKLKLLRTNLGELGQRYFDALNLQKAIDLHTAFSKLESAWGGKDNVFLSRYRFCQMRQESNQGISDFITNLTLAIQDCGYKQIKAANFEHAMLVQQLIVGLRDEKAREKLLSEKKDLSWA
nr:unnamed protein product [Spirometra erinaceieuropaei]